MSNRPQNAGADRRNIAAELPACFLKLGVVAPTSGGKVPMAPVALTPEPFPPRPVVKAPAPPKVVQTVQTVQTLQTVQTMETPIENPAVPSKPVDVSLDHSRFIALPEQPKPAAREFDGDIGGRLRDARQQRKKRMNEVRDAGEINAADRAARARARAKSVRERKDDRLAAARMPSAIDIVRQYLNNGLLKMQIIFNVEEGYVVLREAGYGRPLTQQQIDFIDAQAGQLRALGLPQVERHPWERNGILEYYPAVSALREAGFAQFVNFNGDPAAVWAMEYPLVMDQALYDVSWLAEPAQVYDVNWANGGDGPYLRQDDTYAQVDLLSDVNMLPEPMSMRLEQSQARARAEYDEYMRERVERNPGTYEVDKQLPLAPPTEQERGEGAMPPSIAGGNPGLEPIPEASNEAGPAQSGSETVAPKPPESVVVSWTDSLVCAALQQTVRLRVKRHLVEGIDERIPDGKPSYDILRDFLEWTMSDAYEQFYADQDLVALRDYIMSQVDKYGYEPAYIFAAMNAVITKMKAGEIPWTTCLSIVQPPALTTDAESSEHPSEWKAQSPPYDRPGAPSPGYSPQSPRYDRGGTGDPNSSSDANSSSDGNSSSDEDEVPLRARVRRSGPVNPPPSAADNARSVQEVQVATIQGAASMQRPSAGAYHPIVDMRQNAGYRKAMKQFGSDAPTNAEARETWMMKALIPTVRYRSDFFYLKTDPVQESTPTDRFLSDTHLIITQNAYKMTINGRKSAMYPARQFTLSDRQLMQTPTGIGIVKNIYSVQADNEQSMGFFGEQQLQHVFKHMCVEGKVLFSVNQNKAIQFFPDEFACSNVWWWESKINTMPSSLRWDVIGSGSFNVAKQLRNTDPTNNNLPDHFLFLPPTRIAYGVTLQQAGVEKMFAPTKQNGIIMRQAIYDSKDIYGMQRMIREIMLGALAAAGGFGPRIFAAYVIPEEAHVPKMRINPGDDNACFADPLYRPESKENDAGAQPHNAPASAFYDNPMFIWNAAGISLRNSGRINPKTLSGDFKTHKSDEWGKMVVVMESFAGDMSNMRASEPQKVLIVAELWRCTEKMSASGFLHMDNKYLNMVQRTWRKDGTPVGPGNQWDQIEIKAIDFDPKFVKLCPWLPTEVLMLINISCFLAFDRCFHGGNDLYRKALPRLKILQANVNEKYPDGIAGAFRAILPRSSDDRKGPDKFNGVAGYGQNPRASRYDEKIFQMFNDEWEAARAFMYYIQNYFDTIFRNHSCIWPGKVPSGTSILAQILSAVRHGTVERAQRPPDSRKPGVFDVAAAPTPPCKAKVDKDGKAMQIDEQVEDSEVDEAIVGIQLNDERAGRGLWSDMYNYSRV